MDEKKTVLCGANAYEKKYYFNQEFDKLPQSIKDELHIICVLFTEEVGGVQRGDRYFCRRFRRN